MMQWWRAENASAGLFIAIDVETANQQRASICQTGLAVFHDGRLIDRQSRLINPQTRFSSFNIAIHGITPADVADAPTFAEAFAGMHAVLTDRFIASHTLFDRNAIEAACLEHGLPPFRCRWIDTCAVARIVWPELPNHKLATVAGHLSVEFHHHDAGEDASAAGQILSAALERSQRPLEYWAERCGADIFTARRPPQRRQQAAMGLARGTLSRGTAAADNGPLLGHVVVFTGELSIPRSEAMRMVLAGGGSIGDSVTQRTTLVVVGVQEPRRVRGEKSSKHRMAELLVAQGHALRIVDETALMLLFGQ